MLRVGVLMGLMLTTSNTLADPPAAEQSSDLKKLQGYWKPLQCEYEGQAQMPAEIMKHITVVIDNSEYHLYFRDVKAPEGKPQVMRLALSNITLDPAAKTIQFEIADGVLKGKKSHGIYELAGNQLKLCYCSAEKPRPTKFESSKGSGYFLETWVRQEKK